MDRDIPHHPASHQEVAIGARHVRACVRAHASCRIRMSSGIDRCSGEESVSVDSRVCLLMFLVASCDVGTCRRMWACYRSFGRPCEWFRVAASDFHLDIVARFDSHMHVEARKHARASDVYMDVNVELEFEIAADAYMLAKDVAHNR